MNPRIEVMLDGEYVIGLVDGLETVAACPALNNRYYICSGGTVPFYIERAGLHAECIKAVVEKCNEIQKHAGVTYG